MTQIEMDFYRIMMMTMKRIADSLEEIEKTLKQKDEKTI